MRNLIIFSRLVCAILVGGSFVYLNLHRASVNTPAAPNSVLQSPASPQNLVQATPNVPASDKKELLAAAKAHRVSIEADKIAYVNNQRVTIVRAPIKGIDKYSDADFAKGAPIVLMIIKSKRKLAVPDGSYVVKIQPPRDAKPGKAIFTDAAGAVVAQRDLDGPILTLRDDPDFPDPSDHGETGITTCEIYAGMFPKMVTTGPLPGHVFGFSFPCRDCACDTYNWRRSRPGAGHPPEGVSFATEHDAWEMGKAAGLACMKSPTLACPSLP